MLMSCRLAVPVWARDGAWLASAEAPTVVLDQHSPNPRLAWLFAVAVITVIARDLADLSGLPADGFGETFPRLVYLCRVICCGGAFPVLGADAAGTRGAV